MFLKSAFLKITKLLLLAVIATAAHKAVAKSSCTLLVLVGGRFSAIAESFQLFSGDSKLASPPLLHTNSHSKYCSATSTAACFTESLTRPSTLISWDADRNITISLLNHRIAQKPRFRSCILLQNPKCTTPRFAFSQELMHTRLPSPRQLWRRKERL